MSRRFQVWFLLVALAGCTDGGEGRVAPPPAPETSFGSEQPPETSSRRKHFFVYEVRGRAKDVRISFVDAEGDVIRRRVKAPWRSAEMLAPADADLELEARARRGAYIKCAMKWRGRNTRYGGGNSGESSQQNDAPHKCHLDLVQPS